MSKNVVAAEMSRVYPRVGTANNLLRVSQGTSGVTPINLGTTLDTLENGLIIQVSSFDAFRPGQQIYFFLTVYNGPLAGPQDPWISRVRLKPWWLRTSDDFRAPGGPVPPDDIPTWTGNDQAQFGGGGSGNNRAVWFPHPKMIDVSEWQAVNPPPAAPARHSDSIIVDEVFALDLQDPNDLGYQGILKPQIPPLPAPPPPVTSPAQTRLGRSVCFQLISHGWALGLTHEMTLTGQGIAPELLIDITWQTGTL